MTKNLLQSLIEDERISAGSGINLRLDFSKLLLEKLRKLRWTQKQLALAAGMKESFLSRILHADQNCTFEVADRLARAMNLKLSLGVGETTCGFAHAVNQAETTFTFKNLGTIYAEETADFKIEADSKQDQSFFRIDSQDESANPANHLG